MFTIQSFPRTNWRLYKLKRKACKTKLSKETNLNLFLFEVLGQFRCCEWKMAGDLTWRKAWRRQRLEREPPAILLGTLIIYLIKASLKPRTRHVGGGVAWSLIKEISFIYCKADGYKKDNIGLTYQWTNYRYTTFLPSIICQRKILKKPNLSFLSLANYFLSPFCRLEDPPQKLTLFSNFPPFSLQMSPKNQKKLLSPFNPEMASAFFIAFTWLL